MMQGLVDSLRGYSQSDVDSVCAKLRGPEAKRPDGLIELTGRELRALIKLNRPYEPVPVERVEYQRLNFGKLD